MALFCDSLPLALFCDSLPLALFCDSLPLALFCDSLPLALFCDSLPLALFCDSLPLALFGDSLLLALFCDSLPLALFCDSLPLALFCDSLPLALFGDSLPLALFCDSLPLALFCVSLLLALFCDSLPLALFWVFVEPGVCSAFWEPAGFWPFWGWVSEGEQVSGLLRVSAVRTAGLAASLTLLAAGLGVRGTGRLILALAPCLVGTGRLVALVALVRLIALIGLLRLLALGLFLLGIGLGPRGHVGRRADVLGTFPLGLFRVLGVAVLARVGVGRVLGRLLLRSLRLRLGGLLVRRGTPALLPGVPFWPGCAWLLEFPDWFWLGLGLGFGFCSPGVPGVVSGWLGDGLLPVGFPALPWG